MTSRILIFLLLNFGALGIGGLFTPSGVASEWYANLNKAPWTPAGWVFGAAWTTIMICFTIFMATLWPKVSDKQSLAILFGIQLVLNIVWNPLFFHFHLMTIALIVIVALTVLVGYFMLHYRPEMGLKSALVAPYFIWLLIATTLNAYAALNN